DQVAGSPPELTEAAHCHRMPHVLATGRCAEPAANDSTGGGAAVAQGRREVSHRSHRFSWNSEASRHHIASAHAQGTDLHLPWLRTPVGAVARPLYDRPHRAATAAGDD